MYTSSYGSNLFTKASVSLFVAFMALYPFVKETKEEDFYEPEQDISLSLPSPHDENEHLPDFSTIMDVKEKKKAFFGYLKPLVEQVNFEVEQQRDFVLKLNHAPKSSNNIRAFNKLRQQYRVPKDYGFKQAREVLLRRVDTLPVALVLMQAANESAWGTSRFALEANNLFGQWCFKKGCGVVPTGRPDGEKYEVRKFNHPIASIRSYFNNLNSGDAYRPLRTVRSELRAQDETLDASLLATGLIKYSIRREAYVEEIQNMIRINKKYL